MRKWLFNYLLSVGFAQWLGYCETSFRVLSYSPVQACCVCDICCNRQTFNVRPSVKLKISNQTNQLNLLPGLNICSISLCNKYEGVFSQYFPITPSLYITNYHVLVSIFVSLYVIYLSLSPRPSICQTIHQVTFKFNLINFLTQTYINFY